MIEMTDIKKEFTQGDSKIPILKGIHLFVPKGDFVSIMGPSGSGKSTLASILGFLSRQTSGTFKLEGMDVGKLSSAKLAMLRNRTIGYIFQDFNLLDGMSAAENVALPLVYAGVGYAARHKKALECLGKVGLAHKANNRPNQLSGGQKQRVAIARALVNDPQILFADEPCGALDKKTGMEILAIMQTLNAAGHTIVMVTHSPQDSLYTKRIVHLVDGLIVRDELVEKPAIAVSESANLEASTRERMVWDLAAEVQNRDPAILEKLLQVLAASKEQSAKFGAASSVAKWIDDDRALAALDKLLDEPEWSVRAEVVRSLAKKPAARTTALLMKASGDANPWVRFLAVAEMRFLDSKWLVENQRDRIIAFTGDPDERIRATVIRIMQGWADPAVDELLLGMTRDKDGRVRANAIEALQVRKVPAEKLAPVVANLEDPHNRARANAAVVLFDSMPDAALDAVEKMAHDSNNMMRISAAWALGRFDHERATSILLAAMSAEKDDNVRKLLTKSLAGITDRITTKINAQAGAEAFAREVDALAGDAVKTP
jgi:putative ABC transport system ATP-binding protein